MQCCPRPRSPCSFVRCLLLVVRCSLFVFVFVCACRWVGGVWAWGMGMARHGLCTPTCCACVRRTYVCVYCIACACVRVCATRAHAVVARAVMYCKRVRAWASARATWCSAILPATCMYVVPRCLPMHMPVPACLPAYASACLVGALRGCSCGCASRVSRRRARAQCTVTACHCHCQAVPAVPLPVVAQPKEAPPRCV